MRALLVLLLLCGCEPSPAPQPLSAPLPSAAEIEQGKQMSACIADRDNMTAALVSCQNAMGIAGKHHTK